MMHTFKCDHCGITVETEYESGPADWSEEKLSYKEMQFHNFFCPTCTDKFLEKLNPPPTDEPPLLT
jgi:hypothetical protein